MIVGTFERVKARAGGIAPPACVFAPIAAAGAREGIDRTALVVVGRVLGARGRLAHNGAQAESYERSKLYDPSFSTGYRKASS